MSSIPSNIRANERSLGSPNYWLPGRLDLRRLRKQLSESEVLVAVYWRSGSDSAASASPVENYSAFRMIRRERGRFQCEYFAIRRGKYGLPLQYGQE